MKNVYKTGKFKKTNINCSLLAVFLFLNISCVHYEHKKAILPVDRCAKILSTLDKVKHSERSATQKVKEHLPKMRKIRNRYLKIMNTIEAHINSFMKSKSPEKQATVKKTLLKQNARLIEVLSAASKADYQLAKIQVDTSNVHIDMSKVFSKAEEYGCYKKNPLCKQALKYLSKTHADLAMTFTDSAELSVSKAKASSNLMEMMNDSSQNYTGIIQIQKEDKIRESLSIALATDLKKGFDENDKAVTEFNNYCVNKYVRDPHFN